MQTLERLKEFLRIPSISSDPAHASDCRRAAEWVRDFLLQAGLRGTVLVESEGRHPLIFGEWLRANGKPTLLLYGHYDVQPPEPLELWKSPPFEPEVRGDDLFARGACDDKGQLMILLESVRRCLSSEGGLPVNIKVLIEGEEESGGAHLEEFVAAHRTRLTADAVLVCDTEMFAPGIPTLCTGLRGILYGEIHVQGSAQDLHSGSYGGVAPNALEALSRIIASLKGPDGVVQIPGFYEAVEPPAEEELAAWRSLPFDEERFRAAEVGSPKLTGEAGYSALERMWARPTFEVHGIGGGYTGQGAKTVIPGHAFAKVSCRLVPRQDPAMIAKQLEEAVARATPEGVVSRFEMMASSPAAAVDPAHPMIRRAAQALEKTYGRPAVFVRNGGSIPIVNLFQRELNVPSVLMGFGLPDDNLHAPNEKFHLPNLYSGIEAVMNYFKVLGRGL